MNLKCVESCEKKISELENTQTPISIKDPYHPNHDCYNSKKWWLNEFRKNVKITRIWIKIYSSDLSEHTC